MKRSRESNAGRQQTLLQSALKHCSGPEQELQSAWDSLGKAKSILRQVDNKMTELSKPSSADILWHLPDFLYCLVDQDSLADARKNDAVTSNSGGTGSLAARKVSYIDNRDKSLGQSKLSKNSADSVIAEDDFSLSSVRNTPRKGISDSRSKSRETLIHDESLKEISRDSTMNQTSASAVRDTEIRFLNDSVVPEKIPAVPETAKPPRLHHVSVVVPNGRGKQKSVGRNSRVTFKDPVSKAEQQLIPERDRNTKETQVDTRYSNEKSDSESVKENSSKNQTDESKESLSNVVSNEVLFDNVMPRKVTSGPRAPAYRGFNEPMNRVKSSPVKADWIAKDNNISNYFSSRVDDSPKKPDRVIAVGNHEAARKDIISTNSWRAGAKLQRDLGLTYVLPSKRKNAENSETHGESHLDISKNTTVRSVSEVAENILRDLHSDESKDRNKSQTTKKKPLFKKKSPAPVLEEIHQEKVTKVVVYDADEARKFIQKQKAQRKKEQIEKKEAEIRTKTEKQRRLEDLSRRQHEAAVKSKRHQPINGLNASDVVLVNHREEEEEFPSVSVESESESVDELSERGLNDSGKRREFLEEKLLQMRTQRLVRTSEAPERPQTNAVPRDVIGSASGDDLSAREIVNRFAIQSGLTLEDVVTNYSKYADEIIQSFITKDDWEHLSGSKKRKVEDGSTEGVRPHIGSRLEAILKSSKSLQSRIQAESRKLTTDPVMSSAHVEISAPNTITDDEKHNSENDVVFGADLPGSDPRPFVDDAAKSQLKSKSFSAYNSEVPLVHGKLKATKQDLPSCVTKDETCPYYLRPPIDKQLTSASDFAQMMLPPAKPIPVWDASSVQADPFSILNIFSKRLKGASVNQIRKKTLANELAQGQNYVGKRTAQKGNGEKDRKRIQSDMGSRLQRNEFVDDDEMEIEAEDVKMEIPDDDDEPEDKSSEVPSFSERSDPWPVTPKSEALTNRSGTHLANKSGFVVTPRSDIVTYSADFTDVPSGADVGDDRYVDLSSGNVILGAIEGADGDQYDEDKSGGFEMSPDTVNDVTPITDTLKGEEFDFSDVTTITDAESEPRLLNRHLEETMTRGSLAQTFLAPDALETRLLAELNLLESVDEVLHQVGGMERTRSVAMAQQETVTLAQVLKARQQAQSQEVEAARVKIEKESAEEARRFQARLADDAGREHDAAVGRIRATADAIATLQESMFRLTQTQTDAAKITAEAAKKLSETSAVALSNQVERQFDYRQTLTESAAAAASAAVASVLHQMKDLPTTSGRKRDSLSSELSRRSSGRRSRHRDDRSVRSAKSVSSYTTVNSTAQNSDSGSETNATSAKQSRKNSSVSVGEAGYLDGADSSRPMSVQSMAAESDILTASDVSKVSRNTRVDGVSQRTKSIATATDVSANGSATDDSSISTHVSTQRARSGGSRTSRTTEAIETEKEYGSDYDAVTSEDELEKSLKAIVPSEDKRKIIKKSQLALDLSSMSERTVTNGASSRKRTPRDNSFVDFNIKMVQQYLKEEAVRHQHKQMLLQLRERALKEKTAAELAWLEQQKQKLQKKGSDDRYPELSKKQATILRKHKKYQEELDRLKEANRLTLEAQKLLLDESRGINRLQVSIHKMKRKLTNAGVDESLPDLSVTTDDDPSISSRLKKDETGGAKNGEGAGDLNKEYQTNEQLKKNEMKRLAKHERKLKSKIKKVEKLLESSNDEEKAEQTQANSKNKARAVSPSPRPLESARSVGTVSEAQTSIKTESSPSHRRSSVSETIATERSATERSATERSATERSARTNTSSNESITEEISTARTHTTRHSSSEEDKDSEVSKAGDRSSITTPKSGRRRLSKQSQKTKTAERMGKRDRQKKVESDDSDSADEFTLNQSVQFSGRSEIKGRIKSLAEELKRRKKEAEKLKKEKERKLLKEKENELQKQLKVLDTYIEETKKVLEPDSSVARDDRSETQKTTATSHLSREETKESSPKSMTSSDEERKEERKEKRVKDESRPLTRQSSVTVTDDISEDISTAAVSTSAGGENIHFDLGPDFDDLNRHTPRSARSEAQVPESARTLADIQEDLGESQAQDKSTTDHTEKSSSRRSMTQASEKSNASYTDDFVQSNSAERDGSEEKRNEKSGSEKDREDDESSTEDDISEEILSTDNSQSDAEEEQLEELKILKADDSVDNLQSGDNLEAGDNITRSVEMQLPFKDLQPESVSATGDEKQVLKELDRESTIAERTLDFLLKETFNEIIDIRKQKAKTEDEKTSQSEEKPTKSVSFASANEDENFLDSDVDFSDNKTHWDVSEKPDKSAIRQIPTTMEPVSVVPHNSADVISMVNGSVDLLWNNRQSTSNVSWEQLPYDATLSLPADADDEAVAKSQASYRRLVFDLTAEALHSMYTVGGREDGDRVPWAGASKGLQRRLNPSRLETESVKPAVQKHVLGHLGLEKTKNSKPLKFRRRRRYQPKKSEQLDDLMIQDLKEEESEWIDYSQDELNVKMELADSIFNSLLQETVSLVKTIESKHCKPATG